MDGPREYEVAGGCVGGGATTGRTGKSRALSADAAAWWEAIKLPRRSFSCWLIVSN